MHKSIYGISLLRKDGNPNINLAKNKQIVDFINERVIDTKSFSESVYCYLNDMSSPPKCPVCGKGASYKSFIKGYGIYCSTKCANKDNAPNQSATKKAWSNKHIADIVEKRCNTNLEKYGFINPSQSEEVKQKIKETCLERYGVEYSAQIHIPADTLQKLDNKQWLQNKYPQSSIMSLSWTLGVDKKVIQNRFKKFDIKVRPPKDTKPEIIIQTILDKYGVEYIKKDRTVLKGLELDFYIPSLKLAIEYNGLYRHSYDVIPTPKQKNKHYHKFDLCYKQNIQLIQLVGEDYNKFETFIKAKTMDVTRIPARKCEVKPIDTISFRIIMNQHHLQGSRSCGVKLGIFYNGELVGAAGFNKNAKYQWELSRLVFSNYRVVGGASKLLKHFCRQYNPDTIVSYSANAYSVGNVYEKLGFNCVSQQKKDLWYVKNGKLINRQSVQKHKLSSIINNYNPALTEQQNLLNNGYRIYYGPGTKTWVLSLKENI